MNKENKYLGKYKVNWIEEGMEVSHKDQLSLKMIVRRILRKDRDITDIEGNKQTRSHIIGVECHYWDNKKLEVHKFHTSEIVPYEIAEDGFIAVIKFIEEINKLKNEKKQE